VNKTAKAVVIGFTGMLLGAVGTWSVSLGDNKPDESVIEEAQQLDLYTASRFHDRLKAITRASFLTVSYGGRLGRELGSVGLEPAQTHEKDLTWQVCEYAETSKPQAEISNLQTILFFIHVSLKKQPETVAICNVNKRKLYVRVSFPSEKMTLDTIVEKSKKEGAQLTIRKLISLIEGDD
jgi:hypothetical protein